MKTIGWMVGALVFSTAVAANAQEPGRDGVTTSAEGKAPTNAFEIGIETGYTQPFGDFAARQKASVSDVVSSGGLVELQLGYRLSPYLALGLYGSGAMFGLGNSTTSGSHIYSATTGAHADWHFRPFELVDPWVSLGSGWRGLWVNDANNVTSSTHGWDILRAQIGVDFRAAPQISLAPVVGATVTTFFTQQEGGSSSWQNISDPHANTFIFAGVAGRFDIGKVRRRGETQVASDAAKIAW